LFRLLRGQVDEVATGMGDFGFGLFGRGWFVFAAGKGKEDEEKEKDIFHCKRLIVN
jgi:hypothetical protein